MRVMVSVQSKWKWQLAMLGPRDKAALKEKPSWFDAYAQAPSL